MSGVIDWLIDNVGTWLTAGFVATVVSWLTTNFWESRKLARAERAAAYGDFLDASSRRWRAFSDRDGAAKSGDAAALRDAEARVGSTRNDQYSAYTKIQILGSRKTVEAALNLIKAYDSRNRTFRSPGSAPPVGNDRRADLLAILVKHSRRDLGLRTLDRGRLKHISQSWELPKDRSEETSEP